MENLLFALKFSASVRFSGVFCFCADIRKEKDYDGRLRLSWSWITTSSCRFYTSSEFSRVFCFCSGIRKEKDCHGGLSHSWKGEWLTIKWRLKTLSFAVSFTSRQYFLEFSCFMSLIRMARTSWQTYVHPLYIFASLGHNCVPDWCGASQHNTTQPFTSS